MSIRSVMEAEWAWRSDTAGVDQALNGRKQRQDCMRCSVATYQVKSGETRVKCTGDLMFSEGGNPHVALMPCPSVKALSMISGCPMVLLAICFIRSKPWDICCRKMWEMLDFFSGKKTGLEKKTNLRDNSDIWRLGLCKRLAGWTI